MSAVNSLEKMIKILIKTHPNPTPIIQDLYNRADIWEKQKIKEISLRLGIKLVEEEE